MECDPTRVCELLVGLGDVEIVGVDDAAEGQLRVHIRGRAPRPLCGGCGGLVWSKGERSVELVDLPAFGRPVPLDPITCTTTTVTDTTPPSAAHPHHAPTTSRELTPRSSTVSEAPAASASTTIVSSPSPLTRPSSPLAANPAGFLLFRRFLSNQSASSRVSSFVHRVISSTRGKLRTSYRLNQRVFGRT